MTRYSEISSRLERVRDRIERACDGSGRRSAEITLIAVTKNFPIEDLQILYDLGIRDFGENRDQEGALKSGLLPKDINWHFQGKLQGRKINSISNWADCVHSLQSIDHARKFDAVAKISELSYFVQVNFEPERSDRGGVAQVDVDGLLESLHQHTRIRPIGLMTVAPINVDPSSTFSELQRLQIRLASSYPQLVNLSMGMSGDFEVAIGAGATHLRIGSSILGSRDVLA